jgi:hypothetical protein
MSVGGAQTFTISADGNQTITSVALEFTYTIENTATISHSANLSNLGGSSSFTGSSITVNPPGGIAPGTSKTFSVDYNYVSGQVDAYQFANILVTPTSAAGTGTQRNSTISLYIDSTAPFDYPGVPPEGGPPGGGPGQTEEP